MAGVLQPPKFQPATCFWRRCIPTMASFFQFDNPGGPKTEQKLKILSSLDLDSQNIPRFLVWLHRPSSQIANSGLFVEGFCITQVINLNHPSRWRNFSPNVPPHAFNVDVSQCLKLKTFSKPIISRFTFFGEFSFTKNLLMQL